jgi:hypothetical protein
MFQQFFTAEDHFASDAANEEDEDEDDYCLVLSDLFTQNSSIKYNNKKIIVLGAIKSSELGKESSLVAGTTLKLAALRVHRQVLKAVAHGEDKLDDKTGFLKSGISQEEYFTTVLDKMYEEMTEWDGNQTIRAAGIHFQAARMERDCREMDHLNKVSRLNHMGKVMARDINLFSILGQDHKRSFSMLYIYLSIQKSWLNLPSFLLCFFALCQALPLLQLLLQDNPI